MKIFFVNVLVFFALVFLVTITSAEAAKQQPRSFYMTQNTFTGSQALTACADGYHMASLWEILDVTDLKYNTTLGFTRDDSGSGPPDAPGWVRTGNGSDGTSDIPGAANCLSYTSNNSSENGTLVFLKSRWNEPSNNIAPWGSELSSCASTANVWCVQD